MKTHTITITISDDEQLSIDQNGNIPLVLVLGAVELAKNELLTDLQRQKSNERPNEKS